MVCRFENIVVRSGLGEGEVERQTQVFNRCIFGTESIAYFKCFVLVFGVVECVVHRIAYIRSRSAVVAVSSCDATFEVFGNLSVRIVDAIIRVEQGIIVERTIGRGTVGCGIVDISHIADKKSLVAIAYVEAYACAVDASLLHDTGRTVDTSIQLIAQFVCATFDVESVALCKHGAQRLREPVGIYATLYVKQFAAVDFKLVLLVLHRSRVAVKACTFLQFELLGCVEQMVVGEVGIFNLVVAIVRHAQLACCRSLCLNYNDAV